MACGDKSSVKRALQKAQGRGGGIVSAFLCGYLLGIKRSEPSIWGQNQPRCLCIMLRQKESSPSVTTEAIMATRVLSSLR